MPKPITFKSIAIPSSAAYLAMFNQSSSNIGQGIQNIAGAFSDYGERYQQKQNNLFLDKVGKADSKESLQAVLNAVPSNTNIDPQKLQSFAQGRQNQLRTDAERNLKEIINQNYSNPDYKFSPEQSAMMTPFQRNARNDAGANVFLDNLNMPERGTNAEGRFNNFQHLQQSKEFRQLSAGEQKLVKTGWLQRQGNDANNLSSLTSAQDYDTDSASKNLLNSTRQRTIKDNQQQDNLISRLNNPNATYTPSELASAPAPVRKAYNQKITTPVIRKFANLGGDMDEKIQGFMAAMQSEDTLSLTPDQQETVSKSLMRLNGLDQRTINNALEFMSMGDGAPAPKDRPFVPGFVDGWLNNRNQGSTQKAFVSPEIDGQIVGALQSGATVDQLRSSQLYKSNPDQVEALLQSLGDE